MSETTERPRPAESGDKREPADFDTRELFAGRSEIRIAHDNAIYRLRITRTGKTVFRRADVTATPPGG